MRQTVHICDRCGFGVSDKARTRVCVVAQIPHKRVVAEDDTTETVEVDLCCKCASSQFQRHLELVPHERQKRWLDEIRSKGPALTQ